MSTRRALLLAAGASVVAAAAPWPALAAAQRTLPQARSLALELERALAQRKALVVMVSLHGCPYCKAVRESYLMPLLASGQPVVQVDMGSADALVDLGGRASTHAQVVQDLRARVAPTVYFFGREGRPAAKPLVGMATPDFYGAYLDERVEAANRAVAAP